MYKCNSFCNIGRILLAEKSCVDSALASWHGGAFLLPLDVHSSLGALILGRAWASLFFSFEARGAGYRVARLLAEGRATAARDGAPSTHCAVITSLAIHRLRDIILCWTWTFTKSIPDRLEVIKARILGILHKIVLRIIASGDRELGLQLRLHVPFLAMAECSSIANDTIYMRLNGLWSGQLRHCLILLLL